MRKFYKKNSLFKEFLSLLIMFSFVLWNFSPYFSHKTRAIGLIIFTILIVTLNLNNFIKYLKYNFDITFVVFLIFLFNMFYYFNKSSISLLSFFEAVYFVIPFIFFIGLMINPHLRKNVYYFLILTVILTSFDTFFYLDIDPLASRNLAFVNNSSNPYFINLFENNVGGFEFIYSLPLITISFAIFKKPVIKFVMILISLFFLILIIKSQYTIAIFIQLFSILILLTVNIIPFNRFLLFSIFFSLISFLLRFQISDFLSDFSGYFESNIIKNRLISLSEIITGNFTSDESIRIDLYLSDFNTFLQSPFFGSLIKFNYTNNHSQLISNLAKFGFFYLFVFILLGVKVSKIISSKNMNLFSYYILTIILISIINPINVFFFLTFIYILFDLSIGAKNE